MTTLEMIHRFDEIEYVRFDGNAIYIRSKDGVIESCEDDTLTCLEVLLQFCGIKVGGR